LPSPVEASLAHRQPRPAYAATASIFLCPRPSLADGRQGDFAAVESPPTGRSDHRIHSQRTSSEKGQAFQRGLPAPGYRQDMRAPTDRRPYGTTWVRTCCGPPSPSALAPLLSRLALTGPFPTSLWSAWRYSNRQTADSESPDNRKHTFTSPPCVVVDGCNGSL
jgi:hypothetical protein